MKRLIKTWLALFIGLVIVGGLISWWLLSAPADWPVAKTVGVDKWKWHRPFAGEAQVSQWFVPEAETLSRVDVLVVDFKHRSPVAPIVLRISDMDSGEVLRTVEVSGNEVKDDYYLPFSFEPIRNAEGKKILLTLSAPEASLEAPYAVRLTEGDAIEGGVKTAQERVFIEQDIAFGYYRSTNQAFVLWQWGLAHEREVVLLAAALVLALAGSWLLAAAQTSRKYANLLIGVIAVLGAVLQLNVIRFLTGAVGGDAYYYLAAAYRMAHGINPLAGSLHLPFYLLLLYPALLQAVPDLLWGRILGVLLTTGIVWALVLLARALGFRPLVAGLAAVLLFINANFVVTSVRPRPYTLLAFLLLMSIALLWRVKTPRQAWLWGMLLGAAAITRQETFIPIAILVAVLAVRLWRQGTAWRKIAWCLVLAVLPAAVMMLPYFYENYREFGNPLTSAYFGRSDLAEPDSVHAFLDGNLRSMVWTLSYVWLPSSASGMKLNAGGQVALIFGTLLLVYLAQRWRVSRRLLSVVMRKWYGGDAVAIAAAMAALAALVWWQFRHGKDWTQEMNMVLLAAMILGAVEIIRVGRWRGLVVVGVLLSQLGIATWFHPEAKHYQQAMPFLALGMAVVLLPLAGAGVIEKNDTLPTKRWRLALWAAPLALWLALLGAADITHFDFAIDQHNFPAAPYYVTTAAAEELERYAGNKAAEVDYANGSGIYRLHTYQQYKFIQYELKLSEEEQIRWLCDNDIKYVVDHDDLNWFTVIEEDADWSPYFKYMFEKKTLGRNDTQWRVSVYEFDQVACGR
ncbi:MAG: hypothetical protein U1C49_01890 [Candidatus Andersenbacteria bacterium]|nr:hypothetical protein [bacterium]MDZ4225577.1 hypothetical protein [Candidatus Andersenbacteria bacterium]